MVTPKLFHWVFNNNGNNTTFLKFEKKLIKMKNHVKNLLDFQIQADLSIQTLNSNLEGVAEDTVEILNSIHSDFSEKVTLSKLEVSELIDSRFFSVQESLGRVDTDRKNSQIQFTEELDGVQERISELEDKISPTTDPLLESLLGPDYPIARPAAHSVKEYVDKKLLNMHTHLNHQKKYLASRQEFLQLRRDFGQYMDYVRDQYQSSMDELKREISTLKEAANRLPINPPTISTPAPAPPPTSAAVVPIPVHSSTILNNTNPFLSSPVEITLPPPPTIIDQAYQPIITTLPNSTSIQSAAPPTNTVIYQSVGNIPVPKFRPHLETPENFLSELELYMKRKRVMPEDWILMLPSVFDKDFNQNLWWQSTKLVVKTWSDFRSEFLLMFGSNMDKHQSLEKLLNRRQKHKENFSKFALEMNMIYRKIFNLDYSSDSQQILQFIAERSLPHLQTPLLSCRAQTLVELINFGKMFESAHFTSKPPPPKDYAKAASTTKDEKQPSPPPVPSRQRSPSRRDKPNNKNNNKMEKPQQSRTSSSPSSSPRCSNCPHLNNHSYYNCFKNKKRSERTYVSRNEDNSTTSQNGTTSGNGQEE
jgi:hypothetical protein